MTDTNPVTVLKDIHKGHDVYVIASGASAGFVDPEFFRNKYTIGVNDVWKRFYYLDYIVRKDANRMTGTADFCRHTGTKLIVSKYNAGNFNSGLNDLKHADYVFEHDNNEHTSVNLDVVGTDKIIVSYSTITSAIHLAAYMGAENIIIVGHDCGLLDGKMNMDEYPTSPFGDKFYSKFISVIEPQTKAVRQRIKDVYGCNLYSLNPFLNFGLEDHIYER